MNRIVETLRMYFKLIGISFKGRMQFRTDFFIGVFSVIGLNAASLAMIGVILMQFRNLAGWTIWEIVFMYCFWVLAHSIFSLLFWHLEDLEYYIIEGSFDKFMIRPISPFLHFVGSEVNYMGVADMLVGVLGTAIAMSRLQLHWDAGKWGLFFLFIISGTLIEFGITWAVTCLAFWTGRSAMTVNTVLQVGFMIQRYPVDMFGRWFKVFVTAVVPVAFINYYPVLLLLDKLKPGDPLAFLSYISPLVGLLMLFIATRVWRMGLKQYNSSGA